MKEYLVTFKINAPNNLFNSGKRLQIDINGQSDNETREIRKIQLVIKLNGEDTMKFIPTEIEITEK